MRLVNRLVNAVHDKFHRFQQGITVISFTDARSLGVYLSDDALIFNEGDYPFLTIDIDADTTVSDIYAAIAPVFTSVNMVADYATCYARALGDISSVYNPTTGLYTYTLTVPYSFLYVIMAVFASSLITTQQAIIEALKQLYLHSAETNWLDEWGSYFGVIRNFNDDEADDDYRARIIAEVVKPKCNNVALELAIEQYTGQTVTIADSATPTWFTLNYAFNLLGGVSPDAYAAKISAIVNKIKAAGTRFELMASASSISDSVNPPTADKLSIVITKNHYHDGSYTYQSGIRHQPEIYNEEL